MGHIHRRAYSGAGGGGGGEGRDLTSIFNLCTSDINFPDVNIQEGSGY